MLGQPRLHSEPETNLGYMRPCLKTNKQIMPADLRERILCLVEESVRYALWSFFSNAYFQTGYFPPSSFMFICEVFCFSNEMSLTDCSAT